MKKVSLVIQELLKFLLIYLILFIWVHYFVKKLWQANLICALASAIIYAVIFILSKKQKLRFGLRLKEKEEAENMFLSLSFSLNPTDFFYCLAKERHPDVTKHKNYITINYSLENSKTVLWFEGAFCGLEKERIRNLYATVKKEKPTKIVICCYEMASKEVLSFLANFEEKIVILDRFDTYERLYKAYDHFPTVTKKYPKEKSLALKDLAYFSFNKKRTNGYLFSALILIFSSFFVRQSIYYCLIASLLLVFAMISRFNTHFNIKTDESII